MKRGLAAAAVIALSLSTVQVSSAGARAVNLRNADKAVIEGGADVSGAGDVNGDGQLDVLVSRCSNGDEAGSVFVVFGPFAAGERLSLSDLGERGFVINGATAGDFACRPESAGDVNGDGLDDVLVGAFQAGNNSRGGSGTVYVIFGKSDNTAVELAEWDQNRQGTKGFRIDGPYAGALAGIDLVGSGDVNRDGLDDVVVAAPFARAAYVVFGKTDPFAVDLLTFEVGQAMGRGFRILTGSPSRSTGLHVGAAGDVNEDGVADVVVGYIPKISSPGSAFVVFGKANGEDVNVQDVGFDGYLIEGVAPRSTTGYEVAGVGDVNGDGRSDVGVGAPYASCCGVGRVYVIYGKKSRRTVRLDRLRDDGYKIQGADPNDGTGLTIAAAGDVNADNFEDVALGADGASFHAPLSGSIHVVYGARNSRSLKLPELGPRGYRFDGARKGDLLGSKLAAPGDVTSDGIPDLLTVAYRRDGVAYVVWGR